MELGGIHHLTAISARIRDNHHFYTQTMGMRLVKRSVNQDDVSAYHLFYADAKGSPGTDLTFFDWPVPPERRGTRAIVRTALRVSGKATLDWWKQRLDEKGVTAGDVVERDGRLTLDLEDAEGQRLALIDDGGAGDAFPWDRSPVPAERQIRGLGPITLSVPLLEPTDALLQQRPENAQGSGVRRSAALRAVGPRVRDGTGRTGGRAACRGSAGWAGRDAGRRRSAPRRLPDPG